VEVVQHEKKSPSLGRGSGSGGNPKAFLTLTLTLMRKYRWKKNTASIPATTIYRIDSILDSINITILYVFFINKSQLIYRIERFCRRENGVYGLAKIRIE
jgi:hypothetical protein